MKIYLYNKEEKAEWMNDRMKMGFSFSFEKEEVDGDRVNTKINCVETGEVFKMVWAIDNGIRCPRCGAPEIAVSNPRTVYGCGSSSYDERESSYIFKCTEVEE